jgi:hypothetical protein
MNEDYNGQIDFESVFPRQIKRIYKMMEEPTNSWEQIPDNLCTVCLNIRSSFNYSADPWYMQDIINANDMLKRRIQNWRPNRDVIDECVKKIVEETIRLCDEQIALGKDGCFCFWGEK